MSDKRTTQINVSTRLYRVSKAMFSQDGIYFNVNRRLWPEYAWDGGVLLNSSLDACKSPEKGGADGCWQYNAFLKSRDELEDLIKANKVQRGSVGDRLTNLMVRAMNERFPMLAESCKPNSSTEEFVDIHNQMSGSNASPYRTQHHDSLYRFV